MTYNYNSRDTSNNASSAHSNRTFTVPIMTRSGYIHNRIFTDDQDPYIYPVSKVLINSFGIQDYDKLRDKECEVLKEKILTPETAKGRTINMDLLRAVHRYYFKEIYSWAGTFRTVPLYKIEDAIIPGLSLEYSDYQRLEFELKPTICSLNSIRWKKHTKPEIARQLAEKAVEIWKIHPFRDGNTRATLGFIKIIAIDHGMPLDMSVFTKILSRPTLPNGGSGYSIRDMFLEASLPEKPENKYLIATILKALGE